MNPTLILSLADGLLTLLEKLGPDIQAGVNAGTITPEQQQERVDRARAACAPAAFGGPEWQVSNTTLTTPPTV